MIFQTFNLATQRTALGDVGIRYGYQRFEPVVMVVALIVLVQVVQSIGDAITRRIDLAKVNLTR